MYDIVSTPPLPAVSCDQIREQVSSALACLPEGPEQSRQSVPTSQLSPRRRRGRPIEVAEAHLWLGLLWAVLEGLGGYHALARLLATQALGRFAPVSVTGSAVLQRLQQAGLAPLQALFATLGTWLSDSLPTPACHLAPFASCIIAPSRNQAGCPGAAAPLAAAASSGRPGLASWQTGGPLRHSSAALAARAVHQRRFAQLQTGSHHPH